MLTYGQTVNGTLNTNSIQTSAGDFLDVYWFSWHRKRYRLDCYELDAFDA